MLARWFAAVITNVSEDLLSDLFKAIMREILLKRKTGDFSKAVNALEEVIDEVAKEEGSDDEKNAKLIVVGRDVIRRLRDK